MDSIPSSFRAELTGFPQHPVLFENDALARRQGPSPFNALPDEFAVLLEFTNFLRGEPGTRPFFCGGETLFFPLTPGLWFRETP